MSAILIGYDLHPTKGETYKELTDSIEQISGTWWHCLDSTWIVITNLTAKQVRDRLWAHMRADDQILVVDITNDAAAWEGLNQECGKWLLDNL